MDKLLLFKPYKTMSNLVEYSFVSISILPENKNPIYRLNFKLVNKGKYFIISINSYSL